MKRPTVEWRDLVRCTRREIALELCLPLPWLLLALWAGTRGHYWLMAGAAACVFMLGLRIGHNAFHGNLGLSPRANNIVMSALSVLMGGSLHAIHHTHLRHHRDCMQPHDLEGRLATMGFCEALCKSAFYPILIHLAALRDGDPRERRWILGELLAVALWQAFVWRTPELHAFAALQLLMLGANALAPMVGIWAVHRACDEAGFLARTCRRGWLNWLTAGMFYHLEHHLYPAVPTRHLPELARRLDHAGFAGYHHVA